VTVPLTVADVDRLSKRQRRRWVVRREWKGRSGYWFGCFKVPGSGDGYNPQRFGCPAVRVQKWYDDEGQSGCAHLTWSCSIYDNRPDICRRFPVGGPECRGSGRSEWR
jgi:Fe-S-cluster containining protein